MIKAHKSNSSVKPSTQVPTRNRGLDKHIYPHKQPAAFNYIQAIHPVTLSGSDKADRTKEEGRKGGKMNFEIWLRHKYWLTKKENNSIQKAPQRQTIKTPHTTRITLHHINLSSEREPWETSPTVTSHALIQPITTSSCATARADTLSHSVGKASDVYSCDQRGSYSCKPSTESQHEKKNTPSPLSSSWNTVTVGALRLCLSVCVSRGKRMPSE